MPGYDTTGSLTRWGMNELRTGSSYSSMRLKQVLCARLSRGSGGTASLDYFQHHLVPDTEQDGEGEEGGGEVEYALQQELRQRGTQLFFSTKKSNSNQILLEYQTPI